jgi:hypothetical protein
LDPSSSFSRSSARGDWVGSDSVVTDEKGRFELRQRIERGTLQLSAWKKGYWGEDPVPLMALGQRDVVLRLCLGGSIEGSLDLPAGQEPSALAITIAPEGAEAKGSRDSVLPRHGGSFSFVGLRPGVYQLSVQTVVDQRVVAEVAGVRVTQGEVTRDPRLVKVRLREPEPSKDR